MKRIALTTWLWQLLEMPRLSTRTDEVGPALGLRIVWEPRPPLAAPLQESAQVVEVHLPGSRAVAPEEERLANAFERVLRGSIVGGLCGRSGQRQSAANG